MFGPKSRGFAPSATFYDRAPALKAFREAKKCVISDLGGHALEDSTINEFCARLFGGRWGGCKLAHERLRDGHYYVMNTSYRGGGVHWCAVVTRGGRAYVYDSFGRKTSQILPQLARDYDCVDSDHHAEQHSGSLCGQDSIAWLIVAHTYGLDVALRV